jgi:hypothetical protein
MSTHDTMMHILFQPWRRGTGDSLATPLPGLGREVIKSLAASSASLINGAMGRLLRQSCGIAGTVLGDIDFTGQWYPEETLAVLRPCLALSVDDRGRRWLAETREESGGVPGPVWCVFPDPPVTVHVSEDLITFLALLREATLAERTLKWLRGVTASAHSVWRNRQLTAAFSYTVCRTDARIRGWLSELPFDARIYDLRVPTVLRGWPHGVAGSTGHHFRCGRLPLFAVAGAAETRPTPGDGGFGLIDPVVKTGGCRSEFSNASHLSEQ